MRYFSDCTGLSGLNKQNSNWGQVEKRAYVNLAKLLCFGCF